MLGQDVVADLAGGGAATLGIGLEVESRDIRKHTGVGLGVVPPTDFTLG